MKKILWMVGGFCAAAVGFLVFGVGSVRPVDVLTHRTEATWVDQHTVT